MARSVPQGESESCIDGGVIVGLAGRTQNVVATGRGAGPLVLSFGYQTMVQRTTLLTTRPMCTIR